MMKPPVSENGRERESSDALPAARREEIVDACAQLYEEMPFKDVTILKIGEKTSFTRTSVYLLPHQRGDLPRPARAGVPHLDEGA